MLRTLQLKRISTLLSLRKFAAYWSCCCKEKINCGSLIQDVQKQLHTMFRRLFNPYPKHGPMRQLFHRNFPILQVHFLCFLCEFLFFRDIIQAGRAGLRAGAISMNSARSSSCSSSCTKTSSSFESSSGSDESGSHTGGIMVTTSSEKRTCRFSSTRLWVSKIKRINK